jgi:hypothetical protein
MPKPIAFSTPVPELDSWSFTCDLAKDDGTPLGPAALATLTLTLYDVKSDGIINGVSAVDIKNTGRGALDAQGHLVVSLGSLDNPVLDAAHATEVHVALVVGTWAGGGHTTQEVTFTISNTHKLP